MHPEEEGEFPRLRLGTTLRGHTEHVWAVAFGPDGKTLHLQGVVARPDGTQVLRESEVGSDPLQLGKVVGQALLRRGGSAILESVYSSGIRST